MRILVVGAAGAERTESSLARAARTLGHEARVLDVFGWWWCLGEAGGLVLRWQADRFAPDLVLCTRHAASAGERSQRRGKLPGKYSQVTPASRSVARPGAAAAGCQGGPSRLTDRTVTWSPCAACAGASPRSASVGPPEPAPSEAMT